MIYLILGFIIVSIVFFLMIFIENRKRKGKSDLEDFDPMDPHSIRELQEKMKKKDDEG